MIARKTTPVCKRTLRTLQGSCRAVNSIVSEPRIWNHTLSVVSLENQPTFQIMEIRKGRNPVCFNSTLYQCQLDA